MIRLAGAALAALGCAWLGLTAAAELGRRVRRLEELSAGLELLEREVWERGNPLPEVFCSLSSRTQGAARALFLQGAECCRRLEEVPFSQAWRQSVEELEGVTPEERRAVHSTLQKIRRNLEAATEDTRQAHPGRTEETK